MPATDHLSGHDLSDGFDRCGHTLRDRLAHEAALEAVHGSGGDRRGWRSTVADPGSTVKIKIFTKS